MNSSTPHPTPGLWLPTTGVSPDDANSVMNSVQHEGECGGQCLLELIRARAYQIYEARGRAGDHALDDWLEAEGEIKVHLGFKSPCTTTKTPSS